jgi:hypothetical protein
MFVIDEDRYMASASQRAFLLDLGYKAEDRLTKVEASQLISLLIEKKKQKGLSFSELSIYPRLTNF